MTHYWRCRRVKAGVPCGQFNLAREQRCTTCGAPRPKKRQPAHRAILDQPYEWWVQQFGPNCGICGKPPKPGRRLDRDHCHRTGAARGLLCGMPCNKALTGRLTLEWLRGAVAYLEAHEARQAQQREAA